MKSYEKNLVLYKKRAREIAKELGYEAHYGFEVVDAIENAKSEVEIDNVLTTFRKKEIKRTQY